MARMSSLTVFGTGLLVGAIAGAIWFARPEPIPRALVAPPRSDVSRAPAPVVEGEAEPTATDSDSADEPKKGYALTRMDLEAGLLRVRSRMMACADETTPPVVPIKISIAPSGNVSGVSVPQELRATSVADCLARAVRSTSFPAWSNPPTVPMVEWTYPVRFGGGGEE